MGAPFHRSSPPPQEETPITLEALALAADEMVKALGPSPSLPPYSLHKEAEAEERKQARRDKAKASGSASPSPPQYALDQQEKKQVARGEERAMGENGADPIHARRGLDPEVKARLVTSFACFQSLTTIRDWLRTDYNLKLDDRTLVAYDVGRPDCRVGKRLSGLYHQARKQYVASSANMAVAHQAHRLKLIGQIVEKATTSKDYNAALKGLELAAKEMGGALDGKTTVVHQGTVAHVHGNIEDARAELAMRLQQVVDGGTLLPSAAALPAAVDMVDPTEGDTVGG